MPDPARRHDVSALTPSELDRARRDLLASLAMIRPGSPATIPIVAQMQAIDTELAQRHGAGQASSPRQLSR
jgi:hypothetical protein